MPVVIGRDRGEQMSVGGTSRCRGDWYFLGADICSKLLFLHAYTGCDTTSSIYGIGKGTVFKKLISNQCLQDIASIFSSINQSKNEIIIVGEQTMSILFKGDLNQNLNDLRHKRLIEKISTAKTFVRPEKLPPTISATKYHSLRVYFQMMKWLYQDEQTTATDWG